MSRREAGPTSTISPFRQATNHCSSCVRLALAAAYASSTREAACRGSAGENAAVKEEGRCGDRPFFCRQFESLGLFLNIPQ